MSPRGQDSSPFFVPTPGRVPVAATARGVEAVCTGGLSGATRTKEASSQIWGLENGSIVAPTVKAPGTAQSNSMTITCITWTFPVILTCLILNGFLGESFTVTGTEGRIEWDVWGRWPGVRTRKGHLLPLGVTTKRILAMSLLFLITACELIYIISSYLKVKRQFKQL